MLPIRTLWCLLLVFFFAPISLVGQWLSGHVEGGYATMVVDSRSLGPAALEPTAPAMSSIGATTYGGGVGIGFAITPTFGIHGLAGMSRIQGQGSVEEGTVFGIGGNAVPGTLQHRWDIGLTTLAFGLGVRADVAHPVGIEATAGLLTALRSTVAATETIADPAGVTFQEGSSQRSAGSGTFSANQVVPTIAVRIYTTIPLDGRLALEPSVGVGTALASLTSLASLAPTTFSLGLALRWDMRMALPAPVDSIPSRIVPTEPATTPPVITQAEAPPPFLDIHLDVALMRGVERIGGPTVLRVRRHAVTTITWIEPAMSGTQGGVMPSRLLIHQDTIVDVDPPDVVIVPAIVHDTVVDRLSFRAVEGSTIIWDSTTTTASVDTVRFPLSAWPIAWSLLQDVPATIAVEATARDVTGQTASSLPASIRLTANEEWTDRIRHVTIIGYAPGFSGTASADADGLTAVAQAMRRYSRAGDVVYVRLADAPAPLLQRQEHSLRQHFPGLNVSLVPTPAARGLVLTIERFSP